MNDQIFFCSFVIKKIEKKIYNISACIIDTHRSNVCACRNARANRGYRGGGKLSNCEGNWSDCLRET